MAALDSSKIVGVVGAGAMGAGIAQVAAAAGHRVRLFDAGAGAALAGRSRVAKGLEPLVAKGRLRREEADGLVARIEIADRLEELADVSLVIEAIVEDLEVKRGLLAQLEAIVAPDAILASNTSSISITSIARHAKAPARVAGLHFFNPAPVMKLVEIVSGIVTDPAVAEQLFATAKAWGKVAVHVKSTPGFIVNRVARPYYAEALRLYEEQVASPATIDALLTEGGGFRMGPFELMDLIGHDINYAVTLSVFNAYYQDPRFRPSIAQLELVNAGRLGRKSGAGFYEYGAKAREPAAATVSAPEGTRTLEGLATGRDSVIDGVLIARTDGRTASSRAAAAGHPVILLDLTASLTAGARVGFTVSPGVPPALVDRFVATLALQGLTATRLPDWPGLVVMRTVAMLVNEAFEAVMHGVATEGDIDAAMKAGVNYPRGPVEWARDIGVAAVLSVIDHIHEQTQDPRYRASLGLRMASRPT
jgi:3-hydroxybutyryl-CoA dehydrogenase